ncbi:glycine betaine ABC transporter substrate-binding protein [Corynebacterium sp. MNWGS58]|uniref:glycine betaine ABC transporter substrate-binding protein n=1 Tax=Corynebacterium sp. 102791.4 TaxID=3104612 RepID=UPI003519D06B
MKKTVFVSMLTAASVTLAACSSESSDGDDKELTLGYMTAWSDMLLMANLIEYVASEHGYSFEHTEVNDVAAVYTAVSNGDIDIVPSSWPERTNKDQWERFKDNIEDVGVFFPNARLTLAVPEYSDLNSIDDLAGAEDRLDGDIIGIEAGSGAVNVVQNEVMPAYGLDAYTLKTSSTPAMLAELDDAIADERDIVVTLWRPYWANNSYPVKDLADPKGALGDPEGLHTLARPDFTAEHPELAEWISEISLSDEEYGALEDLLLNKYDEGEEQEAIAEWIEQYGDSLPAWPEQ